MNVPLRPSEFRAVIVLMVLLIGGAVTPHSAVAAERPSFGQNVVGRLGIGMVSPQTPLGVRYFWTRKAGIEAGLGYTSASRGDRFKGFVVDGGWLFALAPGDRTNVFLRPGVRFLSEDMGQGTVTTVQLNAALSFEVFLSGSFSITATTGLAFDFASPPPDAPDSVDFTTLGGPFAGLGFFFYLPAGS